MVREIMEKISAVLISKNEQKLIGRCIKSLAGVDEIVVLDTGSTDKTVEVARSLGAVVKASEPVSPFHFANARNAAHELATNDWILAIDADEILRAGMLRRIRAAIDDQEKKDPFEKISGFLVTFTDRGAITHKKKLYRKSVWNWKHRIHEELKPLGTDAKEAMLESVVMEHLPPPDKAVRHGQNIELLKITIQEEPDYIRAWKYLGQELMLDKAYQDAIPYLAHYVDKATEGVMETSEVMLRVGQCYAELKDYEPAVRWFEMAATTDPRRREPLFNAGQYLMSKNPLAYGDVKDAIRFFQRCLEIPVQSKPGSHHDQAWAWGNRPRQLLEVCQEHLRTNTPR
jgi:glycosyltransferase involved in cell wall biosynthesis